MCVRYFSWYLFNLTKGSTMSVLNILKSTGSSIVYTATAIGHGLERVADEGIPAAAELGGAILDLTINVANNGTKVVRVANHTINVTAAYGGGFADGFMGTSTEAGQVKWAHDNGVDHGRSARETDTQSIENAKPLSQSEEELLKSLVESGEVSREQLDTLSPRGLRAILTLAEEAAAAAAASAGL
jgi:hypothetical protein